MSPLLCTNYINLLTSLLSRTAPARRATASAWLECCGQRSWPRRARRRALAAAAAHRPLNLSLRACAPGCATPSSSCTTSLCRHRTRLPHLPRPLARLPLPTAHRRPRIHLTMPSTPCTSSSPHYAQPTATRPTAATAALASPRPLPPPPSPSPAMHLAEDALPHRDQDPALRPLLARRDQLDRSQRRGRRQLGCRRRHHGLHLARAPPLWALAHNHTTSARLLPPPALSSTHTHTHLHAPAATPTTSPVVPSGYRAAAAPPSPRRA